MDMNELDAEEMFHLALWASNQGDHEKSILYLKRSIAVESEARKLYMLGAQYAEIGMRERAFQFMQKAVEDDPQLWLAYFQAGLLKVLEGEVDRAEQVWLELDPLGEENSLVLFKKGILRIERGESDAGLALMQRGLEQNQENPALNKDMEQLMEYVRSNAQAAANSRSASPETASIGTGGVSGAAEEKDMSHLFLSAYQKKTKQ